MTIPESELICYACGRLASLLPVYPPRCACGWTGAVADLVASGRTRERQFPAGKYPEAMVFRGPTPQSGGTPKSGGEP